MRRELVIAIGLIFVFATSLQAAEPGPPKYFARNASKGFKDKMEKTSQRIKRLESRFSKIEKNKTFEKEDMDAIDVDLDTYGKEMWDHYNEATNRVKETEKSGGKSGGNEEFLHFEDVAQSHVKRLKALEARHQEIDKQIKNGRIKPGEKTIDTMTLQEKQEYKNSLTPEGRKNIEKTYPKMRGDNKPTSLDKTKSIDIISNLGSITETLSINVNGFCSVASREISNFFISRAEASVAIGCYAICAASIGTGCVICVVGAGGTAYDAYTRWRSCMRSCSCRWYRAWCCAKKSACTALFIATLA